MNRSKSRTFQRHETQAEWTVPGAHGPVLPPAESTAAADDHAQRPEFLPGGGAGGDGSFGGTAQAAESAASLPVFTLGEIGDYIRAGYWGQTSAAFTRRFDMGATANAGVLTYNYTGFALPGGAGSDADGLTAPRRVLVDEALDYIGELLGINFVPTTQSSGADILFSDNLGGASSSTTYSIVGTGANTRHVIVQAKVNVITNWAGGGSDLNSYVYQTFIHEIGHALGLGHAGDYDGTINYVTDSTDPRYGNNSNIYLNDSWQASVMSYVDQDMNTFLPPATGRNYVLSFMAGDWEALRALYPSSPFSGNTVYGFNTNLSPAAGELLFNLAGYADRAAFTLVDGGGIDTVDFSGYAAASRIDLTVAARNSTTATVSDIGGQVGNMTLGVGTVIENAIGGAGADVVVGNVADNLLAGGAGNDTLTGGAGADVFEFAALGDGVDRITDFGDADRIRIEGVVLSPASFVASVGELGAGKIFVGSAGGITAIRVGTDAFVGADVVVELAGIYLPSAFVASGTDIVLATNQAPTGTANAVLPAGAEDTPYVLSAAGLLAGISDPDGDELMVTNLVATHGTVAAAGAGAWTFTPQANYHGAVQLSYTVNDGRGATLAATQRFDLVAVPDNPVAVADNASTAEDTAKVIAVLANDSDIDGDTLSIAAVGAAAHGSVVINPDKTITYTPAAHYNGPDTFSYSVADSQGGSASATVSLTVTAAPDAPVAVPDVASTTEDTPLVLNVLANDRDPDGDVLRVTLVGAPAHGSVVINADKTLTYRPVAHYNGPDTFSYTVADPSLRTAVASVTLNVIAVNDAPDAVNDSASTTEDSARIIAVRANDRDIDGDPLVIVAAGPAAHGSVVINPDQTLTYTPAPDYSGPDSISYTISDSHGGSDSATVAITVSAAPDAPVAGDDNASATEDQLKILPVLANDRDPDGNTLSISAVTQPAHGSVTINLDKTLSYRPAAHYNGPDSFSYTITDGTGRSDVAQVTLDVAAVNDTPDAIADTLSLAQDTSKTLAVLANDRDIDADTLSISAVGPAAHGSVVINPDHTLTYTPAAGYNGADSFNYTISDGHGGSDSASVTVRVTPPPRPPQAQDDLATTSEDGAKSLLVLANDSDADGDALTITAAGPAAHGSIVIVGGKSLTYTPAPDYNGPDSFSYTITDGNGGFDSASVNLVVAAVPDLPRPAEDSASTSEDSARTIAVLANDSDPDGDTLSVAAIGLALHGSVSLNPDQTINYRPAPNYHGPDSFSYTVRDSSGRSASGRVLVSVSPANDAPDAVNDSTSTAEDSPKTIAVLANDTDIDGDPRSITAVGAAAHGSVVINPDKTITYTPAPNYSGPDSFSYTISDGQGGSDSASVSVSVTAAPDTPLAQDDSADASEDSPRNINVLANDRDADGDVLRVSTVGSPAHGRVVINADKTLTYTPAPDYHGPDSFSYTVADPLGRIDQGLVQILVAAVNDAPRAVADFINPAPDTATAYALLANDLDIDGDSLLVQALGAPAHGSASIGPGQQVTYTPAAGYQGFDSFSYTASDGQGGSASTTVTVFVGVWPLAGSGDDRLYSLPGNDTIDGLGGQDSVSYRVAASGVAVNLALAGAQNTLGAGLDLLRNIEGLVGSDHHDSLTGNAANNRLEGGAGNDSLDGALGIDSASYESAPQAVAVSLATTLAQNTQGAGTDTLRNIESLIGSAHDDSLTGNSANNTLEGGAGNDRIDGALGTDAASYASAPGGVRIDLRLNTPQDTQGAGIDTLLAIEDLIGSAFDDQFIGTTGPNVFDGGAGPDTVSYAQATSAVTVDLNLATAQATGGGGTDTLRNIENLVGSGFNDRLTSGPATSVLAGGAGNDTYVIDSPADQVTEAANEGVDQVRLRQASGSYTLPQHVENGAIDSAGAVALVGNEQDNQLLGGAGNNRLEGGAGNDSIDGALGIDTASYESAPQAVAVSLALTLAQNTQGAGTDTLRNIENLIGSAHADTLSGNSANNTLEGGAGADTLSGGLGADTFVWRDTAGADTLLDFTTRSDRLQFSQAALRIGDGDLLLERAATVAGPGGFGPGAELVIVTGNIAGGIDAAAAAGVIGAASAAYAAGDTVLFAVDNGSASGIFLFRAADADAVVGAAELTLLGIATSAPVTAVVDYVLAP